MMGAAPTAMKLDDLTGQEWDGGPTLEMVPAGAVTGPGRPAPAAWARRGVSRATPDAVRACQRAGAVSGRSVSAAAGRSKRCTPPSGIGTSIDRSGVAPGLSGRFTVISRVRSSLSRRTLGDAVGASARRPGTTVQRGSASSGDW